MALADITRRIAIALDRVLPWMTLVALVVADCRLVTRYGNNIPYQDEWRLVAPTLANQSLDWSANDDWRTPWLPRAILVRLYQLSSVDFRAGMFASIALLAALSAILIWVGAHIRGHGSWVDAFYPLALLHWGHAANLLQSRQIGTVLVAVLAGLMLALIALDRSMNSGRRWIPALTLAIALCACGGVFGFLVLGWLACKLDWAVGEPGQVRLPRQLALKVGCLTLCIAGFFFVYSLPSHWSGNTLFLCRLIAETFSVSLGPPGRGKWLALIIGIAVCGGVWMLFIRYRKQPGEQDRLLALLLALVGFVLQTLDSSIKRMDGATSLDALHQQVILAALVPCWIFLVFSIYGRSAAARMVPGLMTLAATAMLWPNYVSGQSLAANFRKPFEAFEYDVNCKYPMIVLEHRYSRAPHMIGLPAPDQSFAQGLHQLRDHGIGIFARIKADPPYRLVPAEEIARVTTDYQFRLHQRQRVYGAWIELWYPPSSQPAIVETMWKRSVADRPEETPIYQERVPQNGFGQSVLVWIDGDIEELICHVDRKARAGRITKVTFLMP